MAMPLLGAIVALALTGATCAVVPPTGQVITGEYAECRAAAIEVRFQLTELTTSEEKADITRDKLEEFAATQADTLAVCEEGRTSE